ncbi:MAG TPA: RNA methyltransferase [Pirellulales bacterium]|jgi:TrmH family RNA methyltransferase|nr:RNA methyltransferase [Pirellulales bacterium]
MTWPMLSSVHNPRVKEAVRLRDRRHRAASGRTVIDGARELLRALEAKTPLVEAFVCHKLVRRDDTRRAIELLAASCPNIWSVTAAVYERLAYGGRDDGMVAIAEPHRAELIAIQLSSLPLVAVLEGVEKPGNVGAVLRSADAAGLSALIVADGGTDLYNPNTIRASLGTVFTVPTFAATSAEAFDWLRAQGLTIYAARPGAGRVYSDVDLTGPSALVLGSEAEGLSSQWQHEAVVAVEIPMLGAADSLNVSAAATVLFYEALRQRRASRPSA